MNQSTPKAIKDALQASSEPLRALILSFLVVLLRELVPELQEAPLEAILAPLIGYMIAKGLQTISTVSAQPPVGVQPPVGTLPAPPPDPPTHPPEDAQQELGPQQELGRQPPNQELGQ